MFKPWKRFWLWRRERAFREDARAWHDEHDPEANRESAPPEDESVALRSVWVVEYYTPSNIQSLESAVAERGWDRGLVGRGDVPTAIRDWRRGSSGGWRVVGSLGPASLGGKQAEGLPPGVAYAALEIHAVTPGVTALLGHFVLSETQSEVLDVTLRREYKTKIEPIPGGGESILDPRLLKASAAREAYKEITKRCFEWMTETNPGIFASDDDRRIPAWAFVTFERAKPFSDDRAEYLRSLGVSLDMEAWQETSLPGIRMSPPTSHPDNPDLMLVAGNSESMQWNRDREVVEHAHGLHLTLHRTIVMWGVTRLLASQRRVLSDVRDTIARSADRRLGTSKRLKEARKLLLTEGGDGRLTALQVQRLARNERAFKYDLPEFVPVHPELWHEPTNYPELLRRVVAEQAELVEEQEAEVRDLMISSSSVESAAVNLRLQRAVIWLTVILVLLGGVTIWAAFWLASHSAGAG